MHERTLCKTYERTLFITHKQQYKAPDNLVVHSQDHSNIPMHGEYLRWIHNDHLVIYIVELGHLFASLVVLVGYNICVN